MAPPYDVIDADQPAALASRSPYNIVRLDLPEGGEERYQRAAEQLNDWRAEGIVVQDERPALWALAQDYTGPDGQPERGAVALPACGWRSTARTGSVRTSGPTRAPRRTASD